MKKTKKTQKKPFYHSLVKIERIYIEVQKFGLAGKQEKEVLDLIEHTIHTRAIDAVLEKLPSEKHEGFLEMFASKPDDSRHLDYLGEHVPDIQNHLSQTFESLEKEILDDIIESLRNEDKS